MQINIDAIQVNSGRREALPEAVRELADSISAVGLLNPITVDRDYPDCRTAPAGSGKAAWLVGNRVPYQHIGGLAGGTC